MLVNLLPPWLLQPFVDAAFKKRGIDPEEFWRNAGLPAWRFPDPNGTRFPNGAPPPGADGAGRHARSIPAPRWSQGTPCSYTPTAGRPAAAGRSAAVRAPVDRPVRAEPVSAPQTTTPARCRDVAAEPERPRLHAGRSRRGHPGSAAAGHARRARAAAARLRPVRAPCRSARCRPRAPDFTPGIAPLPPALDGPPPPPGPGPARGPGRHAAAARQPAVPPARFARVGAQTMSTIFNVRNLKLPNVSRAAVIIGSLVVVLALVARHRRLAALQEADQQHRRRVLPQHACAVSRRQGPDHGRPGRLDRLDRARRRQDEGDLPLREQVQGPGQRHRVDPEPEPGRVAHHPAVAALHRRPGDGGQRRHPDRPHPGAGRIRRTARLDQPDPHRPRARRPSSPRARSATSSSPSPTGWPARASRSTRRSTACPRRSPRSTRAAATSSR